jgi:hypothetical protein
VAGPTQATWCRPGQAALPPGAATIKGDMTSATTALPPPGAAANRLRRPEPNPESS